MVFWFFSLALIKWICAIIIGKNYGKKIILSRKFSKKIQEKKKLFNNLKKKQSQKMVQLCFVIVMEVLMKDMILKIKIAELLLL